MLGISQTSLFPGIVYIMKDEESYSVIVGSNGVKKPVTVS